jgi:hypothetical protein
MKLSVYEEIGEQERRFDHLMRSFLGPTVSLTPSGSPAVPPQAVRAGHRCLRSRRGPRDPCGATGHRSDDGCHGERRGRAPGDPRRAEAGGGAEGGGLLPAGDRYGTFERFIPLPRGSRTPRSRPRTKTACWR